MKEAQQKKLATFAAVAVLVLVAANQVTRFLVDAEGPWVWLGIIFQALALVILITCLVKFVRGQRDDYWRERGRDPRNPDQPISGPPST